MPYKDPKKRRECQRRYREHNIEKYRARDKQYNDKRQRLGYFKKWREDNAEKCREANRKCHAKTPEVGRRRGKRNRVKQKEFLSIIKLHYGCQNPNCEFKEKVLDYCLDFHHINPKEKEFNLSKVSTRKIEILIREINKCCILCCFCHRMATYKDLDCSLLQRCNLDQNGSPIHKICH